MIYKLKFQNLFCASMRSVLTIFFIFTSVDGVCLENGTIGSSGGITCQMIDNKPPTPPSTDDSDGKPLRSFDCISTLENSVVVHEHGDVTLECFAQFPLEMDYDGAQPATHIDLEFLKRDLTFETNPETDTYVISIHIGKPNLVWSANYIFHPVGKRNKMLMISVFIHKNYLPLFLPLAADETLTGYVDPMGQYLILPCRVQNYDSKVLLTKDFDEVEEDENLFFDPKIGFMLAIVDGVVPYGEYECYTEVNTDTTDMKKVIAKEFDSSDPEPAKPQAGTKEFGQLEFVLNGQGKYMAICLVSKNFRKDAHTPTSLVNLKFLNPPTYTLKAGCLQEMDEKTGRLCSGRLTGKIATELPSLPSSWSFTADDDLYAILSIYPNGGIQCAHNRKQYFIGTDNNIYFDYNVAAEKDGVLVAVESVDELETFDIGGNYGFRCHFVSYIAAMPIWWIVKFSNGSLHHEFVNDAHPKYFDLTPEVAQISCKISAWNSSQWFGATFDIIFNEPKLVVVEKGEPTNIYFELESENASLSCKAKGKPQPTLQWLKNGQKDPTLIIRDEGHTSVLIFPLVSKDDEGNYTCVATSSTSVMEMMFNVQVKEDLSDEIVEETVVTEAPEPVPVTSVPRQRSKFTLYRKDDNAGGNEFEEIKDISSINPGDEILIGVCGSGPDENFNFTATVVEKKENQTPDANADTEPESGSGNFDRNCLLVSTLTSEDIGEGMDLTTDSFKKGDNIVIAVSDQDCSTGQTFGSGTNVSALVADGEPDDLVITEDAPDIQEITDDNSETGGKYSKTVIGLGFVLICILFVLLFSGCAYYWMEKPSKIYYLNN